MASGTMRTDWITRGLALLALAAGCMFLANTLGPRRIPWVEAWTERLDQQAREAGVGVAGLAETTRLIEAGTHVVIDARLPSRYRAGHLPGAVSLPLRTAAREFAAIEPLLTGPDQPVLVYCTSRGCDEGLAVARFLQRRGLQRIVLFTGGWTEWRRARLPVEGEPR